MAYFQSLKGIIQELSQIAFQTNSNTNKEFVNFFSLIKQNILKDKFLLLLPALSILVRLIIFGFIPLIYEDAYITFRYAENLVKGFGLAFNPGEIVYGTTTPLFALVLAVFNIAGISSATAALIINMIAEGIVTLIVYNLLKDYGRSYLAVLLSLLYVFSPSNISWSIQGMETALFSSIIAAAFYSLYLKKYNAAFALAVLSSCVRIDGLSALGVVTFVILYECRYKTIRIIILPLTAFGGWLLFLYLYFGSVLPNSMIAKLILYSGHQSSILPNLNLVYSKFFESGYYSSSLMSLLFIAGAIIVLAGRSRLVPILIWFGLYFSALIFSRTSIHGWYLIPPLFAYITISGLGIIFVSELIIGRFPGLKNISYIILTSGVILFSMVTLYIKIDQLAFQHSYEQTVRKRVGIYLKENSAVNSTIMLEPIGVIGYFSERYVYDEAALISPEFLELNKLPFTPYNRYKKVEMVKPDYVILRLNELNDFYAQTNLISEYKPVKKINSPISAIHEEYQGFMIFRKNPSF